MLNQACIFCRLPNIVCVEMLSYLDHSRSLLTWNTSSTCVIPTLFRLWLLITHYMFVCSWRIGAKRVIAYGMFPVAILNILTPVVARANPYLFMVLRIFVGLGEVCILYRLHLLTTFNSNVLAHRRQKRISCIFKEALRYYVYLYTYTSCL